MNKWHGVPVHRSVATTVTAVALAVSVAACGGSGGDDGKDSNKPAAQSSVTASQDKESAGGDSAASPSPTQTLATASGGSFQFIINSAKRDSGGFLTIEGTITNVTGEVQIPVNAWNGKESQVNRTASLAAMTLVDSAQKKRYYVLRDTDGYPLTTVNIPDFPPHASVPFFAQFPAPPSSTTQVQMDFPGLPPTTIAIS